MRFTIDADSELARAIINITEQERDVTVHVVAHDRNFTTPEKVVTARLTQWTIHAGCAHTPKTMELEWMDNKELPKLIPAKPES